MTKGAKFARKVLTKHRISATYIRLIALYKPRREDVRQRGGRQRKKEKEWRQLDRQRCGWSEVGKWSWMNIFIYD